MLTIIYCALLKYDYRDTIVIPTREFPGRFTIEPIPVSNTQINVLMMLKMIGAAVWSPRVQPMCY